MTDITYIAVEWWDTDDDLRYLELFPDMEAVGQYLKVNASDMHRARLAIVSKETVAEAAVHQAFAE